MNQNKKIKESSVISWNNNNSTKQGSNGISSNEYVVKNNPKKKFNNRFEGKNEFVSKDGHYGIVANTKNPIKKGVTENMDVKLSMTPLQKKLPNTQLAS